jgi:hypothetical protein
MSESFSCSISVAYSSLGVTKVDHMCLEMGGLIPFLPCKPAPNKLYNVRLPCCIRFSMSILPVVFLVIPRWMVLFVSLIG